jgi:hypothetical protein
MTAVLDDLISSLTCILGVGHELQEDDVYKGHFIPKGTRILPLEW